MELRKFLEKYGERLVSRVEDTLSYVYNPLKPEGVEGFDPKIPFLLRRPYPVQGEIIRAVSKALYRENLKHLFICGEMGTGKTMIALSSVYISKEPQRVLVVCPTHLVEKWIRETRITIPGVEVINLATRNVISILEGLRSLRGKPSYHEVYIISKERLKLGYGWRPAALRSRRSQLPICPGCGKAPQFKDDNYLSWEDIGKKRYFCHCGEALWQADSKLRRYPPSEFIKKYLEGFFDMVILDEIQDYKAGRSLQGQSMGMLLRGKEKCLCLTGTLNGGYADDLFHLLFRMEPRLLRQEGFNYGNSKEWLEAYGVVEWERKVDERDSYYGRGRRQSAIMRKRPGVSPLVIGKYLLERSCFVRLSDVIDGLPPYEEHVITFKMVSPQEEEYGTFERKLKNAIKTYGTRVLSSMLQALLSYPDSCTLIEEEVKVKDRNGDEVDTIYAPLIPIAESLPKEKELVKLVESEVRLGRKVLCYLVFTGWRDIRPRLQKVLRTAGLRVGVLDASVEPIKREAWIERHTDAMDVLLVNAELVKTGLDLYAFPTVVFFQTGYNIFTLRQAARRSWRIGQEKPVKVYFFCYEGTMQEVALSLIAKKLEVALVVEGDLPEGLAEYAVDTTSVIEEMGKILVDGGSFQGAEAAWANFRKKELEFQLGLSQKEKIFEEAKGVALGTPDRLKTRTSLSPQPWMDKNVLIRVSIIEGKRKKQSTVEVKYGDIEEVAKGRPVQFCLF